MNEHKPHPSDKSRDQAFDVIVIGGGQAGLTAAISAAERGCTVCILEAAPEALRGGNSRHTRNLRVAEDEGGGSSAPAETYGFQQYMDDLLRVTEGDTDRQLAELTVRESTGCVEWLRRHGVDFQPPLSGTLHLNRSNAFFLGGGKALVNSLFHCAAGLGVKTCYEVQDIKLDLEGGRFKGLRYVDGNDGPMRLRGEALVAAAGGFEADLDWLAEAWGEAARNFIVRGTPYNRGDILRQLLEAGARRTGDPGQCHAVAVDGRAPKFDGGIASRVDCVPLGIVVNRNGLRFYDEGEDFWPKRYAVWGRLVAQQPQQTAFVIIDSKADGLFMPTVFPPVSAASLTALAEGLGLPAAELERTVAEFNEAVRPGTFNHLHLDDCRTESLAIPKSHWAQTLDSPPYKGYILRPGITFTYMGVKVDSQARVIWDDGAPARNIYAAGEIMGGNILGRGYIAGMGMTIGNVFGRIAGKEAASHATA